MALSARKALFAQEYLVDLNAAAAATRDAAPGRAVDDFPLSAAARHKVEALRTRPPLYVAVLRHRPCRHVRAPPPLPCRNVAGDLATVSNQQG